jgi:hypothetical protein
MLAVQMIAAHDAALLFLNRATIKERHPEAIDPNVIRAARLMRVFVEQVDAMQKLKGKTGQQKVTVEHVLKPDALEWCPCGTAFKFYNLPNLNMSVASDPHNSWQARAQSPRPVAAITVSRQRVSAMSLPREASISCAIRNRCGNHPASCQCPLCNRLSFQMPTEAASNSSN